MYTFLQVYFISVYLHQRIWALGELKSQLIWLPRDQFEQGQRRFRGGWATFSSWRILERSSTLIVFSIQNTSFGDFALFSPHRSHYSIAHSRIGRRSVAQPLPIPQRAWPFRGLCHASSQYRSPYLDEPRSFEDWSMYRRPSVALTSIVLHVVAPTRIVLRIVALP